MMFERFTQEARIVVALASEHARRLGHRYVGGEHILLAAVTADQPASAVLCAHGVTPELVEEEIVRRVGLGAGAGLFGGLDKDALTPRLPEATGRYCAPGPRPSGHIPFTPGLEKDPRAHPARAVARHDSNIDVEHITLALTSITGAGARADRSVMGGGTGR
jgi:ATP-dependent Clp protease ATP-binding subunit ClpA